MEREQLGNLGWPEVWSSLVKIVQVASSYYPRLGGVETHVRHVAEGCVQAGDEVTLLTHAVSGAPAHEMIGGVNVIRFPLNVSATNYQFSWSLLRYLNLHRSAFDLVHAHNYHSLAGHAAVKCRLPFVYTPHYHGTGHTAFRALLHPLYRRLGARQFKAASVVICVSNAERDLVLSDFPVALGKVVTIPNGAAPRVSPAPSCEALTVDEPLILVVGRLERHKNVDLAIDAFLAASIDATMVVVGDGPDRGRLERRAGEAGGARRIQFTGRIPDVVLGGLLAKAVVVASASDHESFGLAVADGLGAGARVVASAIPAHLEIAELAGSKSALELVNPRDTEGFAAALRASVQAGRPEAGSHHLPSWTEVVHATRRAYWRACGQPESPNVEDSSTGADSQAGPMTIAESAPSESV
jgi:1,2-diacylglycerol 3-alpha-glucosyltransferase